MYRVGFKSADLLRMSLVSATAMLAICLLALVGTTNTAEANDSLPENGLIAFTHTDKTRSYFDIYTVNPDGTGLTNETSETPTWVSESSPAWSPDGTKLAFSVDASKVDDSDDVYVTDVDGSTKARRLTYSDDYRFLRVGSWSPDGAKMVLTCWRTGYDVCTMNADGSNLTQLTTKGENEEPNWSPDGTKIACGCAGGIHTMNPDGSNQTLTIAGGDQPDWSPDGTKMVYRGTPPGGDHPDIFIANADGSNPVNLSARFSGRSADRTNPWEGEPAWSPDGTKIAFSSNLHDPEDPTDYEIYVVDANGRNLKRLTHTPVTSWDPDWQPLPGPTEATPEKQQEQRQQNQQQQPSQQGSKSRSETVHQPDTGGPSLLLVASALLISGGVLFYAGLKRRM